MTSSTWRFDTDGPLIGCGVDCETIDRFDGIAATDPHPMPFVFTRREIDHARRQADTASALCLSFTCKEALLKALGRPFDFRDCELLATIDGTSTGVEQEVFLSTPFKEEEALSRAICRSIPGVSGTREIVSTVYLFGEARP